MNEAQLLYRVTKVLQRNHVRPHCLLPDYEMRALFSVLYDTARHWNDANFSLMNYLDFRIEQAQSLNFDRYEKDELIVFYRQLGIESLYGGDFG